MNFDEDKEKLQGFTKQEEIELIRVYSDLCDFSPKLKIRNELKPRFERINSIKALEKELEQDKVFGKHSSMKPSDIKEKERLGKEIKHLESQIQKVDRGSDRKIKPNDLIDALKVLGKKCSRKDIEDMIWEVDENLDGVVDWNEFKLMFQRNINDTSGLEPSKLYNLVQFMIYDKDYNGFVSVDETMNMLYARYGRSTMEKKLTLLFGQDIISGETGTQGGEINFKQYLKAVEKIQNDLFWNSPMGILEAKSRSNPAANKALGMPEKKRGQQDD